MDIGLIVAGSVRFPPSVALSSRLLPSGDLLPYSIAGNTTYRNARKMLGVEKLEHTFSVEMKSKKYVKSISISDEAHDRVLFEGNLGELLELSHAEGDVFEFIGINGVLRIGLTEEQLQKALSNKHRKSSLSAEEGRSKNTQTAKAGKGKEVVE